MQINALVWYRKEFGNGKLMLCFFIVGEGN